MAYLNKNKTEYRIYAIEKDDGYKGDPDAAIDKYYFREISAAGADLGCYSASRQYVVNKVKAGEVEAWTWPSGRRGALCEVKYSERRNVEYLKTVPNGDPSDNLSNLPNRAD